MQKKNNLKITFTISTNKHNPQIDLIYRGNKFNFTTFFPFNQKSLNIFNRKSICGVTPECNKCHKKSINTYLWVANRKYIVYTKKWAASRKKMEGMSRKKSVDVSKLPEVPRIPQDPVATSQKKLPPKSDNNDSLFCSLYGFKDRETTFYKTLNENIKIFDSESKNGSDINRSADMSSEVKSACEEECRDYITPLMNRTQGSISNLLSINNSLDQLDSLHRIIQQLLTVQEQNYQMRKRLQTVKTLHVLKELEVQVSLSFIVN